MLILKNTSIISAKIEKQYSFSIFKRHGNSIYVKVIEYDAILNHNAIIIKDKDDDFMFCRVWNCWYMFCDMGMYGSSFYWIRPVIPDNHNQLSEFLNNHL